MWMRMVMVNIYVEGLHKTMKDSLKK